MVEENKISMDLRFINSTNQNVYFGHVLSFGTPQTPALKTPMEQCFAALFLRNSAKAFTGMPRHEHLNMSINTTLKTYHNLKCLRKVDMLSQNAQDSDPNGNLGDRPPGQPVRRAQTSGERKRGRNEENEENEENEADPFGKKNEKRMRNGL